MTFQKIKLLALSLIFFPKEKKSHPVIIFQTVFTALECDKRNQIIIVKHC